ncbi:hypothetical protein [Emticicia agri]|uniref:Uncharacterized protein n=1 Tax=Emticicia agri TaxID=2492393 RepID=A0A4Q5LTP5_9BACT|nr:hypothetical protein [Emticicia agri]RYU92954.1 hypothetical protein EWM59_24555 [Emticicia agri]
MKNILLFAIFSVSTITAHSQNNLEKISASILNEGKKLYKSEMASWYGTDVLLAKYENKRQNTRGYFSYMDGSVAKCLFFSKAETPKVILTIAFDSTYNTNTALVDTSARSFSSKEKDLYTIRQTAFSTLTTDTLFKRYMKTNLNIIPLIDKGEKKVYILTGPENNGVVIFGNDYLLTFDNQNKLIEKKKLHKSLISMPFNGEEDAMSMHTHLKEMEDYITPTDICTLLLYGKFAKWKQHIVVSDKYVSVWDCKTEKLAILTKEAWEKIYKGDNKN